MKEYLWGAEAKQADFATFGLINKWKLQWDRGKMVGNFKNVAQSWSESKRPMESDTVVDVTGGCKLFLSCQWNSQSGFHQESKSQMVQKQKENLNMLNIKQKVNCLT